MISQMRAWVQAPLLVLARAFRQDAALVCLILKLAADVVEAHVPYLEVRHTISLLSDAPTVGTAQCGAQL